MFWIVTNIRDGSTATPRFLFRNLAMLKLHLKNTRVATTQRIKDEYDRRKRLNQEAIAVLQLNSETWTLVHGPHVENLSDPSDEALDQAHKARDTLLNIQAAEDIPNNMMQIIHGTIKAVDLFSSLNFHRIRVEQFPLTPESLFECLVQNMHDLHCDCKLDAENLRRQTWLSSGIDLDDDTSRIMHVARSGPDRFGCDPDAFARPCNTKKPAGFSNAVVKASLIHIDEMRTLLEMHYDDVHLKTYLNSKQYLKNEGRHVNKRRRSDYKVFRSVVNSHKRRLCQRIELPSQAHALTLVTCVFVILCLYSCCFRFV